MPFSSLRASVETRCDDNPFAQKEGNGASIVRPCHGHLWLPIENDRDVC